MDYLDPKKKRAHKVRLMLGYLLFSVAIGFATIVLVYLANGYYVDRNTGEFIQNGLVFLDSNPPAEIYLNGEKQRGRTDARLVIPAGEYSIQLRRTGYRDWDRFLQLEGGSLRQLTYARMVPEQLEQLSATPLDRIPTHASQSIDKRWLLLTYKGIHDEVTLVDMDQPTVNPVTLTLPETLVVPNPEGAFEVVEWSDDDATVLMRYTVGGSVQYVLLNRTQPLAAQNLNQVFNSNSLEISLRDRSQDEFFAFDTTTRSLHRASLRDGLEPSPVIEAALIDYAIFGNDWFTYIVASETEDKVEVRLRRGSEDMLLREINKSNEYFIEMAKLNNVPVIAFCGAEADRVQVYFDPEKYLADNPEARVPIATTVLFVPELEDVIISADSSVVMAYGGQRVASHEFEADRSYSFQLEQAIDDQQEIRWIDGQHFLFSSEGTQFMSDFDGSNVYALLAADKQLGSFYDEDIERMFSVTRTPQAGETPAQITLNLTSLLTAEDR